MPLYRAVANNLVRTRNGAVEGGLEFRAGGLKGSEKGGCGFGGADLRKSGRVGSWIEGGDGSYEGLDCNVLGASREEGLGCESKKRVRIGGWKTGKEGGGVALSVEVERGSCDSRRQQLLESWALCGAKGRENFAHTHRLGHGKWVKRGDVGSLERELGSQFYRSAQCPREKLLGIVLVRQAALPKKISACQVETS
jgi:hypothetical protein